MSIKLVAPIKQVGAKDAVIYNPQELTDAQKAQARTNIGANSEPFKVTLSRTYGTPYLDKTPKEIYDAYTAGKYVYLEGTSLLPLTYAKDCGNEKYTISFSGTSKVSEDYDIQVTSFSVIEVSPTYRGKWIEDYKYNIDAKVLELNYNPSSNKVSGNNPYNSIAKLNHSGQSAVIRLLVENGPKIYLNQIAAIDNKGYIFQSFVDALLQLNIESDSMNVVLTPPITRNDIQEIVDQGYVAYDIEQTLTDGQKKHARDNIGAISSEELIISSSTPNSTKKFKITVDDTGTLTATETEFDGGER